MKRSGHGLWVMVGLLIVLLSVVNIGMLIWMEQDQKYVTAIIRFFLTVVLAFCLMVGMHWARIVTMVLCVLGSLALFAVAALVGDRFFSAGSTKAFVFMGWILVSGFIYMVMAVVLLLTPPKKWH